ncbi:transferrin-binding protein-like solute binding protein [Glaesserella sp.]|uniref:transferrin-binding protein-like solute binding protein n=1 Tax=Glaesserella sp. TaxID=2094731 RepID=UPI0035A132FF
MKRLAISVPISLIFALTSCGSSDGRNSSSTTSPTDSVIISDGGSTTSDGSTSTTDSSTSTTDSSTSTTDSSTSTTDSSTSTTDSSTSTIDSSTSTTDSDDSTDNPIPAIDITGSAIPITGHYAEFTQLETNSYNHSDTEEINNPVKLNIADLSETDNIDSLNIDGVIIDLKPTTDPNYMVKQEANGDVFVQIKNDSGEEELGVGIQLDNVRYGVLSKALRTTSEETYAATAFVQGKQTPIDKIPTSGVINYEGQHIAYTYGRINAMPYESDAASVWLTADFDNKVVEGDLGLERYLNRHGDASKFTAKISGSSFATEAQTVTPYLIDNSSYRYESDDEGNEVLVRDGDPNYIPRVDNVVVNGAFYGPNAEEVAGTFYSGYEGGAFGAKKVPE